MIIFYYQIKTLINFYCKRELYFRSFIQQSKNLSVELTGTHKKDYNLIKPYTLSYKIFTYIYTLKYIKYTLCFHLKNNNKINFNNNIK